MDIKRLHYTATIKIVGLGSSGADAVNRLSGSDLEGVDLVLVHAGDPQPLTEYDADAKIGVDKGSARVSGAGGNSTGGPQAVRESEEELREALKDADMIVLIAGEGEESEIGVAPLIGEIAKEIGALIAGVIANRVDLKSHDSARLEEGVQSLREAVDMLIMVPDDTLLPGFLAALRGT
jgi:cell division protein FtsZ